MNQPQRKIRVGVVGCGVVATAYYLPFLLTRSDVEITAVCDRRRTRAEETKRLFGAKIAYDDYGAMLRQSDVELVFVLTGPGTHVAFTVAAVESGRDVLLQKPMALDLEGAEAIVRATRRHRRKVLVEPSDPSPIGPHYAEIRRLVRAGVLGKTSWFSYVPGGSTQPGHPSLQGNPYGEGAFYAKDSGGMIFDYAYGPSFIATVLGSCKRVTGIAVTTVPDRFIVPEDHYDAHLARARTPEEANYWDAAIAAAKTQPVKMEAPDNAYGLFEMADGAIGVYHFGRPFQPTRKGFNYGGLQIFGTEGNLYFGAGHQASLYTTRRDLVPETDADGWHHWDVPGDWAKARWPQPAPGSFNYYHESTKHILDCIRDDRDPVLNVEFGRHVTEMMYGTAVSARTGRHYDMQTSIDW